MMQLQTGGKVLNMREANIFINQQYTRTYKPQPKPLYISHVNKETKNKPT